MKKSITKLLAVIAVLLLNYSVANAADVLLRFSSSFSNVASYSFSTTDVLYPLTVSSSAATTMSSSTSNVVFASPNNYRAQLSSVVLELKSTSASAIKLYGMSSGSTSTRTIYQISVADTKDGTYSLLDDVTSSGTKIVSTISGQSVSTSTCTITGLSITQGKFVKLTFCTSSSSTSLQNINISGFDITPIPPSTPKITSFTAAGVTATINESAKTITATLPFGTDITKVSPTIVYGGTATSVTPASGVETDFTNPVTYTVTDGTTPVNYTVTLTVPSTPPAPSIALATGAITQTVKAGGAITNIVYNLTNVNETTGATVTGLPAGLSGQFVKTGAYMGTYTLSGTLDAGVSPAALPFTVTASPIDPGYSGAAITSGGTVNVKSATARTILYLASSATTTANDLFLNQLTNDNNFVIIKRTSMTSGTPDYTGIDLIFLHESLTGSEAETATNELYTIRLADKPMLNTKSYLYSNGTNANRWNWGTTYAGGAPKGVKIVQPSHPVFNGITITDSLYIYNTMTNKSMQPTNANVIKGINLGVVPGGIAIHEVPPTLRGVSASSKYLLISLYNTSSKYMDLTADGLKLLTNAIDYLLNGTQFVAPTLNISSFNVASVGATIDQDLKTIEATVAIGTDLTALSPVITLAGVGTTVSPASGVATNFSSSATTPVSYTVTDGINSRVYAVKVTDGTTKINEANNSAVSIQGSLIKNPNQERITVYNTVGRIVATSNGDIQLNEESKGAYIVKTTSGKNIKFVITK